MHSKTVVNAIKNIKDRLTRPLHLEFNLTDYCNLNCKGCSHYSPLADKEFQPLTELEHSMQRITEAKNVEKIQEIYLIGGETLLYPQLIEAIKSARKYFPEIKISIFTNGLLIPKMSEDFWKTCRDNKISIALTRYPVKFDYDNVEQVCKENKVNCEVFGDRSMQDSFFKLPLDPDKKQIKWLSHFRCCSFGCVTIDKGKIFPCSQAACVGHLNKKFGLDFRWEKGDYINVDDLKDINEIIKLRIKPIPFCGYCKHQTFTPYGPSRREKEEWM